jgi:hypothetical protein
MPDCAAELEVIFAGQAWGTGPQLTRDVTLLACLAPAALPAFLLGRPGPSEAVLPQQMRGPSNATAAPQQAYFQAGAVPAGGIQPTTRRRAQVRPRPGQRRVRKRAHAAPDS